MNAINRKKSLLILGCVSLLALGACNSSDDFEVPAVKRAPAVQGEIEASLGTRAGVNEGNDYRNGEKFVWHDRDQINVCYKFTIDEGSYTVDYMLYEAERVEGNQADFIPKDSENLFRELYDIYAFYPASIALEEEVTLPQNQTQTDRTSGHLGAYMPLRAVQLGYVYDWEDPAPLELKFRQLASVVRFSVWNATAVNSLKIKSITTTIDEPLFSVHSWIWGTFSDGTDLFPFQDEMVDEIGLDFTGDAGSFVDDAEGRPVCDGYMVVLPTGSFDASDDLTLTINLTDGSNDYRYTRVLSFGASGEAAFLAGGFKKAESYYFRLLLEDSTILPVP